MDLVKRLSANDIRLNPSSAGYMDDLISCGSGGLAVRNGVQAVAGDDRKHSRDVLCKKSVLVQTLATV